MALPVVAVHGSFAQNVGREILHICQRGVDDLSVRLANAHIVDVEDFGGRVVSEDKLAQFLNRGLALHTDDRGRVADTSSVGLETHQIADALIDQGFFGGVGLPGRGGECCLP